MLDAEFDRAAAVLHGAAAVAIELTTASQASLPITAIRYDEEADPFDGPGRTLRQVSFELRYSDVPDKPEKGARIRELTPSRLWAVKEITQRDDIGAWSVVVGAVQT